MVGLIVLRLGSRLIQDSSQSYVCLYILEFDEKGGGPDFNEYSPSEMGRLKKEIAGTRGIFSSGLPKVATCSTSRSDSGT
jgi:hypothetical protein